MTDCLVKLASCHIPHNLCDMVWYNDCGCAGGWIDGTLCSPAAEVYDCSRREWVSGEQQQHRDQWDNLPALNVARKLHG